MDIAAWLRELGLERYEQAFRDNDDDAKVLPRLTAEDLKEIGISSVGHRRSLLAAIETLRPETAIPEPEQPVATALPATEPSREAERRQLTVMFVDLVGSTELSARLDPEDLRAVMGAYQAVCAKVVARFDGHVAKFLGDGVLAYFGWPRAHEDDAERAVRAGLALVEAVAGLEARPAAPLQARAGIATGQVVVGDLISQGAADPDSVTGETPNVAARLQTLAAPGSVVIAEATRRLTSGVFELDDLGPQCLKGFAEPLAVWRVTGESRAEGRFEARQTSRLTLLIGRDEEMSLLLRRWRQAKDGEGQVVLLSGEPGIGKSRLVRELRGRIENDAHTRLLYQCSPHHTTSPLHPVIEQLERAAGFERDDPAETRLAKLEALLARGTDKLDEAVSLVAALFGIAGGTRFPLPEMTPQRQKQRTLEVLVEQLEGLSAEQPVLLTYEDVHWIDPSTQELLGLAIERIQRLPVLTIITFRPEFSPPWSWQPHMSALALTRLGRRDGTAMVGEVVGDKTLPDEVAAQIVAKTDGVPLFVEELTKTVLESGLLTDAGDRWELSGPLPPLAIPSTLHDSLLARLDRLAPVKEVAQIGAAIGREFSHALLAAVAQQPEAELRTALDQLVSAELVFRHGAPPEATYSFKHALVRDAAYDTLLKSKRQQLHARIARVLEEQFSEQIDAQPELAALHCASGGLGERAVDYWYRAGQQAIARWAMAEAVAQLSEGLALLQALPASPKHERRELGLQLALSRALVFTQGAGAPERGAACARARALAERLGAAQELFAALAGQGLFHHEVTEFGASLQIAGDLLRLARHRTNDAAMTVGHMLAGIASFSLGGLLRARESLEQALVVGNRIGRGALAPLFPLDPDIFALTYSSWALALLGYLDQARERCGAAVAEARRLADPFILANTMGNACCLYQFYRDPFPVRELAEEMAALVEATRGYAGNLRLAAIFRGWVLADEGQPHAAVASTSESIIAELATGIDLEMPYYLALAAEVHGKAGQASEALRFLDQALVLMERTGERWFEAELRRRKGEVLLCLPEPDREGVEAYFHRAIAVAQEQQAKLWELRAAIGLARLWRDQGRRTQAYDLLAPVYGWFTEGLDTADLKMRRRCWTTSVDFRKWLRLLKNSVERIVAA